MEVSAEDGVVNGKYGVCKAAIVEAAMASKLQLRTPLTTAGFKTCRITETTFVQLARVKC